MLRRSLEEVITLYTLEPQLRDIYVEGITDKLVIERYLLKNKINDFKIIEIDLIDFCKLYNEFDDLKRNNKRKIVTLAEKISNEFTHFDLQVYCIADKDFDEYLGKLVKNKYLIYTDYTCLEMYLYNRECITIFYKNIVRNFPFPASQTLNELSKVLVENYLIRLVINIRNEIQDKKTITDLKKSVKITKKTGKISFDTQKHVVKILNNNRLKNQDDYLDGIEKYRKSFSNDVRNNIRGHDFIHLFFLYINKIKNNVALSEEMLERSLFQCIDYSELQKYSLFSTLSKRFSK